MANRVQASSASLEPHTDAIGGLGDQNHVFGVWRGTNDDVDVDVPFHVLRTVHEGEHENGDADRTGLEPEVRGDEHTYGVEGVDQLVHDVSSTFLTVITASGFCEREVSGGASVDRRSAALRRFGLGA